MKQLRVGFALCGSFCTLSKAIAEMRELKSEGADILPIMSENAYSVDTRFGKAADIVREIEDICGKPVIHTITDAEPIGPKKMIDILKDYLKFDEEGNKRIYALSVIAVKDGEILDFDDETAWDTKGYKTPEEYWKNEDLEGLKEKLAKMFEETKTNICTSDCNK